MLIKTYFLFLKNKNCTIIIQPLPYNVMTGNTLPWVEKYRPFSLCNIKGHTDIIRTLSRYKHIENIPHLLLYGPPGTGKTSTILAMARDTYGKNMSTMVLEMNASDERGVDIVKNTIQSFVETKGIVLDGDHKVKLVILDEADAMTSDAQTILRRIIERYTMSVRFCICCNFVNKIIPELQSRCTRFRFPGVSVEHLREKILDVIDKESVIIDEESIDDIISISDGDTRKMINLLQSSSMSSGNGPSINREDVYRCSGKPYPKDISIIINVLSNGTFSEAYGCVSEIINDNGYSLVDIVQCVYGEIPKYGINETRLAGIMNELSDIEYRISQGGSDLINTASLVSSFKVF